jgi:hypothetical protein
MIPKSAMPGKVETGFPSGIAPDPKRFSDRIMRRKT